MSRKLFFDDVVEANLTGWAAHHQENGREERITLQMGGVTIAQRCRHVLRPDVDKVVGEPGRPKGYELPFLAAVALSRLLMKANEFALKIKFSDEEHSLEELAGRYSDLATHRSLRLHDRDGPYRIADVWFATELQLRFRIEESANANKRPLVTRFYQPSFSASGPGLELVDECSTEAAALTFCSPTLKNPFFPVLISVSTTDGETLALDLVPFPSLCRGGVHHSELFASGTSTDYIADLRLLSDCLLREFDGWPSAPPNRSVGKVLIDLAGASGSERIFSPYVLEWLTRVMLTQVGIREASPFGKRITLDDEMANLLRRRIATYGSDSANVGGCILALPGDAVPTISVLASRRLALAGENGETPVSFIAVSGANSAPSWLVRLPPLSGLLNDVQPPEGPFPYPTLTAIDPATKLSLPGAIRFIDDSWQSIETDLFPVSPQLSIRSLPKDQQIPTVSVLISVRNGTVHYGALLQSLINQTVGASLELVVVNNRSSPWLSTEIENTTTECFPGRSILLEHDDDFNHSDQINLAARRATGEFLLIVDPDVILHDSRTIAELCLLAQKDRVASVACMLVSKHKDRLNVISCGIFPSGYSLSGPAIVPTSQPQGRTALPLTTYPVLANSLSLMMVKAEVWNALGGLNQSRFPSEQNDVDYCVRALNEGWIHLCTTGVSAYYGGTSLKSRVLDVHANNFLPPISLEQISSSCTTMRRIA